MKPQVLRFIKGGKVVSLPGVDANRTLLEVLREDLHCTGTKEGCGEGDCGACTVVVAEQQSDGLKYSAINSCIRLAHSVEGLALWTVEDLDAPDGTPHPAQQAMVDCHGSQCGFCTPGFVMSLFGAYQTQIGHGQPLAREQARAAISGNLCRCTGYRPILDAAQAMTALPPRIIEKAPLLSALHKMEGASPTSGDDAAYLLPRTLSGLLAARARHPAAQIVAGCTDVGLWITKQHRQFERVLDVTRVAELRRIEPYPHHIAIGSAVTLTDAFAALVADRPQLTEFANRFAGMTVRNSGTLGGNIANGSPIGDSMPLLIALDANVVLMRQSGSRPAHRELALEDLYTGYRQNVMTRDEVLAWVKVPKATPDEFTRVYKISKRFEDDISAVCLAIRIVLKDGRVQQVSIGAGGVAATPARARKTEAALRGQVWSQALLRSGMDVLKAEFAPISDMRASAAYRRTVLGNLLQRFWLQSQGTDQSDLRQLVIEDGVTV